MKIESLSDNFVCILINEDKRKEILRSMEVNRIDMFIKKN